MNEILVSKVIQAGLVVVAFFMHLWAQIPTPSPGSADPFAEAAKYGFAVLVLTIVLYMLFREYRQEKEEKNTAAMGYQAEIQRLNKIITEMVDRNREALMNSSQAINNLAQVNQKVTDTLSELNSNDNSK